MIGNFTCCQCKLKFRDEPGAHIKCPKCGHIYATWDDWPKFKAMAENARKKKR